MFYMQATTVDFGSVSTLLGYLDPGSGSMMLQVLIAGLFSSLFFVKSTLGFVKNKLVGFRMSR